MTRDGIPVDRRLPDEAAIEQWPGGGGRVTSMGDRQWLTEDHGAWVVLYAPRQFYDGLRALATEGEPTAPEPRETPLKCRWCGQTDWLTTEDIVAAYRAYGRAPESREAGT